jgi:hypothetical protein
LDVEVLLRAERTNGLGADGTDCVDVVRAPWADEVDDADPALTFTS